MNFDSNNAAIGYAGINVYNYNTSTGGNLSLLESGGNLSVGTVAFAGGKLNIAGNIYPATDNTYYLGKNDDDTPYAWRGVILKDTTNGKYYRVEVINGVVTATDLTD